MPQRLTIEELAAATGLTVGNIREHQRAPLAPFTQSMETIVGQAAAAIGVSREQAWA